MHTYTQHISVYTRVQSYLRSLGGSTATSTTLSSSTAAITSTVTTCTSSGGGGNRGSLGQSSGLALGLVLINGKINRVVVV